MGDGFQYLDIVLFAAVAGFLIYRLRSVLGKRTGAERRRDPFAPTGPAPAPEKVVPLPQRDRAAALPPPAVGASPTPLASGIARLAAADKSFDENGFLQGARGAFELIVNAFAKGDTAALQPLLSEAVYASFAEAIRARQQAHETLETNLTAIKSIDLIEAGVEGTTALVTVKFVSDQTHAIRAQDGSVVDGDPERVIEKTDLWTFSRSIRASDPNWTLVATQAPH